MSRGNLEAALRRAISHYVSERKQAYELMKDTSVEEIFLEDYANAQKLQELLDNAILVTDEAIIYTNYQNRERLFDKLDEDLHDTTWRELDEKVDRLTYQIEELESEVEHIEAV